MSSLAYSSQPMGAAAGLRVLLIIPGEEGHNGSSMIFARRQGAAVAEIGADVRMFFLRSRTSIRVLWAELERVRRMIAEHRPEVIHAHFGTVTAVFSLLAAGSVPLVITYRGSDLNPVRSSGKLRSWTGILLSQGSALFASAIVCVSQQLKGRLWWNRYRATVLPSGVDPEIFAPMPRALARRRLGWPEQERVVLFNAGHDPANKRLDLARAAVSVAQRQLPDLRLEVMVGKTDPRTVPLLMNAADCLLVTSDSEGSPTVVQEALATNLPIVSVEVGDVPERIRGVQHTRVVKRDSAALAEAIVDLVRAPLRSDGRSRVDEFSSRHIARELHRTYYRVRKP